MGYDISIRRLNSKISQEEWLSCAQEDSEFETIEGFSTKYSIKNPRVAMWNEEIPFVYNQDHGEIIVKSPEIHVVKKMISLSKKMNAIVIGEEDELYNKAFIEKEENSPPINIEDYKNIKPKIINLNKKWWQFWKEGTHL